MQLPYESANRKTWLSVSGRSLALPCFCPSISSIKTNLEPREYLRMLVSINHPQFLVSAFDIYNASPDQRRQFHTLLQTATEQGQLILLDSGNYESYWGNNNLWNIESFHSVLQTEPCNLALCFDQQDEYQDIKQIVNSIEASVLSTQPKAPLATVIPIVHGNPDILPETSLLLTQRLHPVLIAIPERELGSGIISRATTLLRIRKTLDQTGQYYPLHLLGTGNPLSILIYSMCGANSFDGLEWCQTTVDHRTALLYHFSQREFFSEQTPFSSMSELPYVHATLAHNLMFYGQWIDTIQNSLSDGTIVELVERFLGKPFYDTMLGHLLEVA